MKNVSKKVLIGIGAVSVTVGLLRAIQLIIAKLSKKTDDVLYVPEDCEDCDELCQCYGEFSDIPVEDYDGKEDIENE